MTKSRRDKDDRTEHTSGDIHDEAFSALEKAWMEFHTKHQAIVSRIKSLTDQKHPFI
ncbi:MAG: hypothetical protein RDU25_00710 [Patescibacteria group bacterium]|nr:hypothetical protein [Patescibacteria group bacterium]